MQLLERLYPPGNKQQMMPVIYDSPLAMSLSYDEKITYQKTIAQVQTNSPPTLVLMILNKNGCLEGLSK